MSDVKKSETTITQTAAKAAGKVETTTRSTATAVTEAATAYVSGVSTLIRTVYGIGQEIVQETVDHGRASVKANSVGDLVSMQAGYAQHRIGASTVHVKELADVASDYVGKVYSPLSDLLSRNSKA